ncbi:ABC1 kinase family protein [Amphibacillus jilinensis]|uniref:ABC1 kinase family protein n=1 Tax=Amphibacillus jilinensis TaxID=1216008 RepID=UPI00031563DC|nr:AarF/ABC1/UbiB kinase family protein [Amphibacillus jilinensis]
MFEKRMRHLQRYKDIIVAFSRNGLGFLLKELGLSDLHLIPKRLYKERNPKAEQKTLGERIRLILEELGPTFIKFGQIASTRRDLFPENIIQELEKLQNHVPPFSYQQVYAILEQELGSSPEQHFLDIDKTPLAAASIGQVHLATLKTGERVAVKVQRPDIENKIETDFEIMKEMATLAELRIEWAVRYRAREVVEEFAKTIRAELDYINEARNTNRIAMQFSDNESVYIPSVNSELTTSKVLVMEYIDGIKLKDLTEGKVTGYDKKKIAEQLTRATFQQVLIDGFFHADPHPGNILVLPDEKIALLDFGMVGRLTEEMKQQFGTLLIALMQEDTGKMVDVMLEMGVAPEAIDKVALKEDVDLLMDKYYRVALSEISLADAIRELFEVAYKHKIELSADFTLLGKTLLTLEGTIEQLDPELSIVEIAEPFGRKMLRERYHPKRIIQNAVDQVWAFSELFTSLPKQLKHLSSVIKNDKIRIEIVLPDLKLLLKKMDRISNQLSFAIVLLAFSIIMVGLIIGSALSGQGSLIWSLPAIEIGFFVAVSMFIWLLYSIFKSGRF